MTAPLTPTSGQPRWAVKAPKGMHRPFSRCMPYCSVRLGQGMMSEDMMDFLAELDNGEIDEDTAKGFISRTLDSPEWAAAVQSRVSGIKAEIEAVTIRPDQVLARNGRGFKLPTKQRSAISKAIHGAGKGYYKELPFKKIFEALSENGARAVLDPAEWAQKFVEGHAKCGSSEADSQRGNFEIAIENAGRWVLANLYLAINWCVMTSGNYEIVAYIS